jgi:hypothetical protein
VYLLVFQAYINEMNIQEAKSAVTKFVRQRCEEGFNSGVKGLTKKSISLTNVERQTCQGHSEHF